MIVFSAKPIIYSNAMTSYWPGHFKDKILSPFASSGIPILRILDLECSDTKKIIKQVKNFIYIYTYISFFRFH